MRWLKDNKIIILVITLGFIVGNLSKNSSIGEEKSALPDIEPVFIDRPDLTAPNSPIRESKTYPKHGFLRNDSGYYVQKFSPNLSNIGHIVKEREGFVYLRPQHLLRTKLTAPKNSQKIQAELLNAYKFETEVNSSTYCKDLGTEFTVNNRKIGQLHVENTERFKNYSLKIPDSNLWENINGWQAKNKQYRIDIEVKNRKKCSLKSQTLLIDKVKIQ